MQRLSLRPTGPEQGPASAGPDNPPASPPSSPPPHEWPLREAPFVELTAAGLGVLRSTIVPEGQIWRVDYLSAEGDKATSGGNDRARVYIDSVASKLYMLEQITPAAGSLYWEHGPWELWAGERLVMEWDEALANTVLRLYFWGVARLAPRAD